MKITAIYIYDTSGSIKIVNGNITHEIRVEFDNKGEGLTNYDRMALLFKAANVQDERTPVTQVEVKTA